jgi:hypothetical protein
VPIIEIDIKGYPETGDEDQRNLLGLVSKLQGVFATRSRKEGVRVFFPRDRLVLAIEDSETTIRPVVTIRIRGLWVRVSLMGDGDEEEARRRFYYDSFAEEVGALVRNSIEGGALVECTIEVPNIYTLWSSVGGINRS